MKELIEIKDNVVIAHQLVIMDDLNNTFVERQKALSAKQQELDKEWDAFKTDRDNASNEMWQIITHELKRLNLLPAEYESGDTPLEINNGIICEYEDLEYIKKQFPGAPDNVIQEIFDAVMKEKEFKKSQKGAE